MPLVIVLLGAALPLVPGAALPLGLSAPPPGEATDGMAISLRTADLVALDLARLGAEVWPRAAGSAPLSPAIRSIAATAVISGDKVTLDVRVGTASAAVSGRLEDLDALACSAARRLAPALGLAVPDGAEALLGGADPAPGLVHLTLGHAGLDLASGQMQRARMRFGRAEEIWRGTLIPEAALGSWLAQIRGTTTPEVQVASAEELARSALEKADYSARAPDKGVVSLGAAMRFWTDRALAWATPLDRAAVVSAGERAWWIGGATDRAIEPRTGAVLRELRGKGRWIGEVGEDALRYDGTALVRTTASGAVRWSRALPWKNARVDLAALAGGFVLVRAEKGLAWIDATTGAIAQADPGAIVLAAGLDGAIVEPAPGRLALSRPGRKAPSWNIEAPERGTWVMVPGRAIEVSGPRLRIVDTHDGKARGAPITLPAGARVIGADGRFVIAGAARTAVVIDALAGSELRRIHGPGEALVASATDSGVIVAFDGGDVLFLDREAAVVDRARVFGRPVAAWPGRPHAPGFLVRTEAGLFALGPVPSPERPRDVEVAMMLATRLEATGNVAGARRWAEHVALLGMGRVAEAEALRARVMGEDKRPAVVKAAAAAARRAKVAGDLGVPLPAFDLD